MRTLRNSSLLACSALLFVANAFAITTATLPQGYTRQEIMPGAQAVGVTLVNPVVFSAAVVSNTTGTLAFGTSGSQLADLLSPDGAYYVELTSGNSDVFVGERFEIDVAATRAQSAAAIVVQSDAASANLPLAAGALSGYRASIREHVTLGQVFGTRGNTPFHGSIDAAAADQVLFFDRAAGSFVTYYLHRTPDGALEEWRRPGDTHNCDDTVIAPGTGLFFQRSGTTPAELLLTGGVRANDFVLPLAAGYNLVSLPFPVQTSPAELQMNCANGFVADANPARADQILIFNGSSYDTYYLHRATRDSAEEWHKLGSTSGSYSTARLLNHTSSVFIRKVAADAAYVASCPVRL